MCAQEAIRDLQNSPETRELRAEVRKGEPAGCYVQVVRAVVGGMCV